MRETESTTGTDVSPKGFAPVDYIKITIFGFAMTALWSSLHSIILPLRLLDFVAEAQKNTYLGLLTATGLLLAIAVQPIAGAFSDRSGFRWGRRRPFILVGAIAALSLLPGIGFARSLVTIFAIYYLLQISCNTALGPYQAFIPDLVPEEKRGRASGVKGLLEIVGGVTFIWVVGHLMSNYSSGQGSWWLWLSLGILGIVFLSTMIGTVLTVKEQPGTGGPRLPLLPTLRKSFRIDVKATPDFKRFLVSRLLFIIPLTTFMTFGLYFFKDVAGVADPAAMMGNFALVTGGCMAGMVYPAGRLSDRLGRRPVAFFSGLIGALGIGLLFFFHGYHPMLFAAGLLGIGLGGLMGSNWALAVDLVPRDEAGKYIGLTNLATAGGSILARLQGPMIDFANAYSAGLGYTVMLWICFGSIIASSVLLRGIKQR